MRNTLGDSARTMRIETGACNWLSSGVLAQHCARRFPGSLRSVLVWTQHAGHGRLLQTMLEGFHSLCAPFLWPGQRLLLARRDRRGT